MIILKNGPADDCDLDHSKAGCLWHLCEKCRTPKKNGCFKRWRLFHGI